mmetsp:Transcript_20274/g.34879  ORF Transcript_20274/g.34879 Transcript_20274/m.34879 type:complete len:415 (-) Transcript_20274:704-1948(-)|eukprot:CAMPEP_0196663780 /NCGR_PEP_ID=MMETSP1086-20130531/54190_1 /TAXON_ID=77921 /ORGANISM="Cyanoptyche  gloeocystis , Strain SAG4.97" /LENGTH=414 /DNA_ID=CAMNT_0041999731 /DNA_START=93 /DNA_END=1337 /DNA_ORIENTATION=-
MATTPVLIAVDLTLVTVGVYKFLKKFWIAREERRATIAAQTPRKPVRVWMDGCFDMFHFGHANALRQAKALGDVLVVGVCSDAEILKHKGPPVMNEEERYMQVESCKWVDEIVTDVPYEVSEEYLQMLVDKYQIDFIVHGDDECLTADGRDAYEAVKKAGRFKTIKRTEGVSSTDIVGRMLLLTKTHHSVSDPDTTNIRRSSSTRSVPATDDITQAAQDPFTRLSHFLPTTRRIIQFSAAKAPKRTDTIVYITGSFDMFHCGHIEILKRAREMGDFLLVGVLDDSTVNQMRGSNYPIMNLHERVLSVLSCKYVDEVIIGAPLSISKDMIVTMNIKVVAHERSVPGEPSHAPPTDPYAAAKELGIYREIPYTRNLTARDIVDRILVNRNMYEDKFAKKDSKEKAYLANKEYVPEV